MSTVFEQLQEKFIMKNAREDWKDYRRALTETVNEYPGRSIAIVGAGRCNDIELSALDFEHITLIDVDAEAMKKAAAELSRSGGVNRVKEVSVVEASLTGITNEDTERFCEQVLTFLRKQGRELTPESFEGCLENELDTLEKKLGMAEKALEQLLPEKSFDVVLCSGVCSQLFSLCSFFIRSAAQSVAYQLFPEAVASGERAGGRLARMNGRVIPVIDRALVKAAKKAAVFGNEDPTGSRVEGAYQSISFLRENYMPEERELMWNFNSAEGVRYRMRLQIVRI